MVIRSTICLILINLIGIFPNTAKAADENMDSSVYLTFDPVTGQFTSATKDLSDTNQFVDTGIQQGQAVPEHSSAQTEAALNMEQQSPLTAKQGDKQNSLLWIGGAVALFVLGIIGFLMRKGRQKSAT